MGLQLLVLLSAIAGASALSHRKLNSSTARVEDLIPTSLGYLPADIFGKPDDPLVLMVHGKIEPEDVYDVFDEHSKWLATAKEVAKLGYKVIVPNFNACHPRMECGLLGTGYRAGVERSQTHKNLREQQFRDILKYSGSKKFAAIMGHSWGGYVVSQFVFNNPNYVDMLVVSAPGPRLMDKKTLWTSGKKIGTPTLVLWTKDDIVQPVRQAKVVSDTCTHSTQFIIPEGGHDVHKAYIPKIVKFMAGPMSLIQSDKASMLETNAEATSNADTEFEHAMEVEEKLEKQEQVAPKEAAVETDKSSMVEINAEATSNADAEFEHSMEVEEKLEKQEQVEIAIEEKLEKLKQVSKEAAPKSAPKSVAV